MGFLDSLGGYFEEQLKQNNNNINEKIKMELRNMSDEEVRKRYENRYTVGQWSSDSKRMQILEREAHRRGIC